ncbi:hypothetical protein HPB52_008550 [Rhipicephalus sanguineus]|uniref:Uncharacterized protein n=1 Tax=Rhipicephalus sanguineus TaxID=34632 RepID=A0A9D4Q805_RHISA|nr:hypothetical protein HPB52_008550 [Rhipicephalus sanguineus]
MEEQATKHLLKCLTESRIFKDLSLGSQVVPESCRGELSQYLMFSSSLTSLRLADNSEKTQIAVLEGILENEILEELSIFYRIWNPEQWIRFANILSSKQRLKVSIICDNKRDDLFRQVCRTLEDSGVDDKASCGLYLVNDNVDLLKCKVFSGLLLGFGTHEDVKATALHKMLDCSHLKSLIIDIRRVNVAVSSALAEYVQSTSVLRELRIDVGMTMADDVHFAGGAWWRLIVDSLSRNNSIKRLNISVFNMSDGDVESMVDAVSARRNIRKLTFGAWGRMTLNAFVNRLSVGIMGNHTLLGVVLQGRLDQQGQDASRKLFAIYEATRRNSGLLAAGAAFSKATDAHRYAPYV